MTIIVPWTLCIIVPWFLNSVLKRKISWVSAMLIQHTQYQWWAIQGQCPTMLSWSPLVQMEDQEISKTEQHRWHIPNKFPSRLLYKPLRICACLLYMVSSSPSDFQFNHTSSSGLVVIWVKPDEFLVWQDLHNTKRCSKFRHLPADWKLQSLQSIEPKIRFKCSCSTPIHSFLHWYSDQA